MSAVSSAQGYSCRPGFGVECGPMRRPLATLLVFLPVVCSGCAVVTVADAAISVAATSVKVAATVVETTVDVAAAGVKAAAKNSGDKE